MMPMILWTRQFMEGQGYTIDDNIVYQDNQSSMLLEKNGQQSSTKRTRHLDIRYFFVTDRIRAKQLTVEYCPTGDMWADIHTKPLQGATFAKFCRLILNLQDDSGSVERERQTRSGERIGGTTICSQECVEDTGGTCDLAGGIKRIIKPPPESRIKDQRDYKVRETIKSEAMKLV